MTIWTVRFDLFFSCYNSMCLYWRPISKVIAIISNALRANQVTAVYGVGREKDSGELRATFPCPI